MKNGKEQGNGVERTTESGKSNVLRPDFGQGDSGERGRKEQEALSSEEFEAEDAGDEREEEYDEWEDDDWGEVVRPWMIALLVLGLTALVAIVCAVIWYFAHLDGDDGRGQDFAAEENSAVSQVDQEEYTEPVSEPEEVPAVQPEEELPKDAAPDEEDALFDEPVDEAPEESGESVMHMAFAERNEAVTPKEAVNLRSAPTTADDGNIVVQVKNGEILTRTGINTDTGWSELAYGGQTVYAVSQYLTEDTGYRPATSTPASDPNQVTTGDGRVIVFKNCDDWISPKEYVNLRTEPSTSEGNGTVSCRLEYGEKAHRTGYSEDTGWSRVEYDGKVLYVVTSLVYEVEP